MLFASLVLFKAVKALLIKQIFLSISIGLIAFYFYGVEAFYASVYGGGITIAGTILMAWHINRAGQVGRKKQQGYIEIYLGVIKKFILTIVLFIVGLGLLELDAKVVIITFALTQITFLFNQVDTSYHKNDS